MAFDPEANPKDYIIIKGASVHNLKKLDVTIPRNRMVVITGLSGSGKSSLAFDTLYAEGQRRYVESLSAYARQFIGRMDKPEVEFVKGISPAIAIEQKVNVRNPRSTVGTSTEIYDYLKLLFARIGKTYSPTSGQEVKKHTISDVTDFCSSQAANVRIMIFAPLVISQGRTIGEELSVLLQKGFTRVAIDGTVSKIEDIADDYAKKSKNSKNKTQPELWVLIDRFTTDSIDDEFKSRIADSAQTAFFEGRGTCHVQVQDALGQNTIHSFSNRFELDGMMFEEPSVNLFSFNNPFGACKNCEGFGSVIGIDEDLVVPDKSLSVYDGAIMCWRGEKMKEWNEAMIKVAHKFNFPIHRPYYQLNKQDRDLLWIGNSHFKGINEFFQFLEENNYKIQYRVMLSRYRGKTACPECHGTRLRSDANVVKVSGNSITDLVLMPV
ncbi:MAG: excinuclease ABC subunit A, partial [Bacteroidota bacterium]